MIGDGRKQNGNSKSKVLSFKLKTLISSLDAYHKIFKDTRITKNSHGIKNCMKFFLSSNYPSDCQERDISFTSLQPFLQCA